MYGRASKAPHRKPNIKHTIVLSIVSKYVVYYLLRKPHLQNGGTYPIMCLNMFYNNIVKRKCQEIFDDFLKNFLYFCRFRLHFLMRRLL